MTASAAADRPAELAGLAAVERPADTAGRPVAERRSVLASDNFPTLRCVHMYFRRSAVAVMKGRSAVQSRNANLASMRQSPSCHRVAHATR